MHIILVLFGQDTPFLSLFYIRSLGRVEGGTSNEAQLEEELYIANLQ